MNDEPLPKESMYGSNAATLEGGGRRKKKARKTMRRGGGEKKMPGLTDLFGKHGGNEHMKKYGHGGSHKKGHGSRRRKSNRNKTARRR